MIQSFFYVSRLCFRSYRQIFSSPPKGIREIFQRHSRRRQDGEGGFENPGFEGKEENLEMDSVKKVLDFEDTTPTPV